MNSPTEITNNRILVIDDNPAIHEDIRKILIKRKDQGSSFANTKTLLFGEEESSEPEQIDFQIDSAFQGEEGFNKVEEMAKAGAPYALAFVDVRMPPGWDGVETITQIWKKHPKLEI